MSELIRFGFALAPRMQSFLELRDGLLSLETARQSNQPYAWLLAAADVRASLLGEHGRKQALPELIGLLGAMRTHLQGLARAYPKFAKSIEESCEALRGHSDALRKGIHGVMDFLSEDGLLNCYIKALQKQDVLAHKPLISQSLALFWRGFKHRDLFAGEAHELYSAITHLDAMLNDFVPWSERLAEGGVDQVTPDRGAEYGLLIVGLAPELVQEGVMPEFSGNRLAIRVRFRKFVAGKYAEDVDADVPYSVMLVPLA